jgi:hypothetical protein
LRHASAILARPHPPCETASIPSAFLGPAVCRRVFPTGASGGTLPFQAACGSHRAAVSRRCSVVDDAVTDWVCAHAALL